MLFTKREVEVLKLRRKGMNQNEIADELDISQAAVSKFECNAKQKLQDAKKTVKAADKLDLEVEEHAVL